MSCMHNVACLSEAKEYTGIEMSASYISSPKTETTVPQVPINFIIKCMYISNHHVHIDS